MQTILLYIHLAFLALAAGGVFAADKSAFGWMQGKVDAAHRQKVFRLHWIVTTGLVGLVLTGLYMFWPLRDYLLGQPLFWVKMFFVVALLVNSFFIEKLMHVATSRTFASLSPREKTPLYISGGLSTLCWLGAAGSAIFLFGWLF